MNAGERVTLRNLYLYLVCLITLVIAIFAAVSLVRNAVELFYPTPTGYPAYSPATGPQLADQTRAVREEQRHQAVLGLVGAGTTLALAGPLYAYHWRRVQSEYRAAG